MKLFPRAKCPKCKGPVTFFDVMSIVTPFQSISCMSCGESVFLKHQWGTTLVALGACVFSLLLCLALMIGGTVSNVVIYAWVAVFLVSVEFAITLYVVKKNHLVVREE